MRGLLALISIVGVFVLAIATLSMTGEANLPAWSVALAASVSGFYFGGKGANGNGSYARKGE